MSRRIIHLLLALFLITVLFAGCARKSFQKRITQHGQSEELNYEYTNLYYKKKLRKRHFTLNIEIDKPALISLNDVVFNDIHSSGSVRGSALVKIRVNPNGSVVNYKIVKKAGVGLDEYISSLLGSATFIPVEHREVPEESDFLVMIVFKD